MATHTQVYYEKKVKRLKRQLDAALVADMEGTCLSHS